jgi:uncharacterized protein
MEKSFDKSRANFMGRTLLTMSAGLLVTFIIAFITPYFMQSINPVLIFGALIGEVVLVFYLSARINKMSVSTARMWFYVYAALNGFTLSIIFVAYASTIISTVFLITSAMFFCSAMVGITTKKDLSAVGQFFMMLLIGVIILSLVQMFFNSAGLNFVIAILGIVIFCGLTAYDMQRINKFHSQSFYAAPDDVSRFAIIAALGLYLDFINIFLFVLRLYKNR